MREKALKAGADCGSCLLAGAPVIYPSIPRKKRRLAIVGETPGFHEEEQKAFFVGPSGEALDSILAEIGVERADIHINNAGLCRPPQGTSPAELRKAATACSKRLQKDLKRALEPGATIVAMGAASLFSLTGKKTITPWIGAPLDPAMPLPDKARVVPSLHVAYAMREPAYWVAIFSHLDWALNERKARKWPRMCNVTHNRAVARKLLRDMQLRGEEVGLDIETAGASPWAPLTALGVADSKISVSMLPGTWPKELVETILTRQEVIAHNGWHDILGLRAVGIPVPDLKWDTLLLHAALAPRLRHNLSLVAAIEFPGLERWKSEFKDDDAKGYDFWAAIGERDPEKLLTYNAKDAAIMVPLKRRLWAQVQKSSRARKRYDELLKLAKIAAEMRIHGIQISEEKQREHLGALRKRRSRKVTEIRARARDLNVTDSELHPRKRNSLIKLLYSRLGLPVLAFSKKTGAPSVNEGALVKLMLQVPDGAIQGLLRAILAYRKYDKLVGTYLVRLDPKHERSYCDRSWTCRPSFNVAGTLTKRWACDNPNLMNWPKGMRNMVVSRPGWYLLSADYSALELRIAAAFAGDMLLLKAFAQGSDIHMANAQSIFGDSAAKGERDLAKRYVYGARGGGPEAIWMAIIVEAPESGITINTIRRIDKAWKKAHPKLGKWESEQITFAQRNDYVELPLSGFRIPFHGKVKPTEPQAYVIQGTAADVMNDAVIKLRKALNDKRERILLQIHDDLVLETRQPVATARKMQDAMARTITLNGNAIHLPIDFKVGTNWGEAVECKTIEQVAAATNGG